MIHRVLLATALMSALIGPLFAQARLADRLSDSVSELLDPNVLEPVGFTDEDGLVAYSAPASSFSPFLAFQTVAAEISALAVDRGLPWPDAVVHHAHLSTPNWPAADTPDRHAWLQSFLI